MPVHGRMSSLFLAAMRVWCGAREGNVNPLPRISRALPHDHAGVIAVVVNGFMTALRTALGHEPRAGKTHELSEDETMALDLLLDGMVDPLPLDKGELERLQGAALSARIMFRLIPDAGDPCDRRPAVPDRALPRHRSGE